MSKKDPCDTCKKKVLGHRLGHCEVVIILVGFACYGLHVGTEFLALASPDIRQLLDATMVGGQRIPLLIFALYSVAFLVSLGESIGFKISPLRVRDDEGNMTNHEHPYSSKGFCERFWEKFLGIPAAIIGFVAFSRVLSPNVNLGDGMCSIIALITILAVITNLVEKRHGVVWACATFIGTATVLYFVPVHVYLGPPLSDLLSWSFEKLVTFLRST